MKAMKKLPLFLLVAAPFLMPVQSRAGVLGDLLNTLFGNNNNQGNNNNNQGNNNQGSNCAPGTGNSVPLDGGVVFLMVAGLGLGAKLIYDARGKKQPACDI